MTFPLSPDMTHQTETFGPLPTPDAIELTTEQVDAINNLAQTQGFVSQLRAGIANRSLLAEKDPTGRDAHVPGAKLDAGKCRPGLVLGSFARALWAVSMVGTYGAIKYTEDGWISVPNGQARYDDAGMRHWLKEKMGEPVDPDTDLDHAAHAAWNALARLDLMIRERESKA
jgi:hypothetical protein